MSGIKMEMEAKMEMGIKNEIKTEMNDVKQEPMELVSWTFYFSDSVANPVIKPS
jgi:hypothetical protein